MAGETTIYDQAPEYTQEDYDNGKKLLPTCRFFDAWKRMSPLTLKKPHKPTEYCDPAPNPFTALFGTGAYSMRDKKKEMFNSELPFLTLTWKGCNRVSFWIAIVVGILCGAAHWAAVEILQVTTSSDWSWVWSVWETRTDPETGQLSPSFNWVGLRGIWAPLASAVGGFILSSGSAEAIRWSSQMFIPSDERGQPEDNPPQRLPGYVMGAFSRQNLQFLFYTPKMSDGEKTAEKRSAHVCLIFDPNRIRIATFTVGFGLLLGGVVGYWLIIDSTLSGIIGYVGYIATGLALIGGALIGFLTALGKEHIDECKRTFEYMKERKQQWELTWDEILRSADPPDWVQTKPILTGYDIDLKEHTFLLRNGESIAPYHEVDDIPAHLSGCEAAIVEGGTGQKADIQITDDPTPRFVVMQTTKTPELNPTHQPHLYTWEIPEESSEGSYAEVAQLPMFVLRNTINHAFRSAKIAAAQIVGAWQHHKLDGTKSKKTDNPDGLPPPTQKEPVVWQVLLSNRGGASKLQAALGRMPELKQALRCDWVRMKEPEDKQGNLELWFASCQPSSMILKDERKSKSANRQAIPGGSSMVDASSTRKEIIEMDWRHLITTILKEIPGGFRVESQDIWNSDHGEQTIVHTVFYPKLDADKLAANLEGDLDASFLYAYNDDTSFKTHIVWGWNIPKNAYLDPDAHENTRRETLIAAFRKNWATSGGKSTYTLPDIQKVTFHSDPDRGIDVAEIHCLPGNSKPISSLQLTDITKTQTNMAIEWLRVGQTYDGELGYSIAISRDLPPKEAFQPDTELSRWMYALEKTWALAEKKPELYGLRCLDVQPLDKDNLLFLSEWKLPPGTSPYVVSNRLTDLSPQYEEPVGIPSIIDQKGENVSMKLVFGEHVDTDRWISNEMQETVAGWDWANNMDICQVVTADHKVPIIKETRITNRSYTHHIILPRGMSPDDLKNNLGKIQAAGNYSFLEFQEIGGENIEAVCSHQDPFGPNVVLPKLFPRPKEWMYLPIGMGVRESPYSMKGFDPYTVAWDLKNSPHMLLSGTTGGGKSVCLRTIAAGAIASGFELYLVDAQKFGGDFKGIKDSSLMTTGAAWSVDEAHELIKEIYFDMKERTKYNVANGVTAWYELPPSKRPRPKLLIIDEAFTMLDESPGDPEENNKKKELKLWIGKLAAEARAAGVHMILAVQRGTVKAIEGNLKNNLSARLLLGPANDDARKVGLLQPSEVPKPTGIMPKGRGVFEQAGWAGIVQIFWPGETADVLDNIIGIYRRIAKRSDEATQRVILEAIEKDLTMAASLAGAED